MLIFVNIWEDYLSPTLPLQKLEIKRPPQNSDWKKRLFRGPDKPRRPSIDRSTDPIDRFDNFRSFENFWKDRLRRDDRFCPKIIKIRTILAIFRPFENFCEFRFDRFDVPFDSIDIATEGHGGPPWQLTCSTTLRTTDSVDMTWKKSTWTSKV